uniref:hypothetical protein n=3 Tax=Roseivirga sp. TaxID=1964215 RepID=UPI004048C976
MRIRCIILFLAFVEVGLIAQAPCRFSWKEVRLPGGGIADYTSPQIQMQPFQGPCMAFALSATLESQIEISSNNPGRDLDLSEAYLDYSFWGWDNASLLSVFDNNYAIFEEGAGNFPGYCSNEMDCQFISDVQSCLDNGQCFDIVATFDETQHTWVNEVICKPCPTNLKKALGIDVVKVNASINSVDQFKMKLMNEGPMILRLNGTVAANKLSSYGSTGYSWHAVSIIGWKDVIGGVKLHFKDSWPGSANFKYSHVISENDLLSLINQGVSNSVGFELYQIQGAKVVGERFPLVNYSFFSPQDQCSLVAPPKPSLMITSNPVIKRGQLNTLLATIPCSGEPAVDWEWSIPNAAVNSPVKNTCSSTIAFTTNTMDNTIQIKVRAKSSSGAWSEWQTRNFLIDNNLN